MFITSIETDQLFQALLEFQKECPHIEKKTAGGVRGSKYADRSDVLNAIKPLLIKNHIFIAQAACSSDSNHIGMTTRIVHALSNQWMEVSELRAAGVIERNDKGRQIVSQPQADGAVLTYMSRQQIVYLLSIPLVGEDDEELLTRYMPQNKKNIELPNRIGRTETSNVQDFYEKGIKLIKEMAPNSDRAISLYEYCEVKGFSHWQDIPPLRFKEDKDLHSCLKLSGVA